jgi:hypothetical protein
VTGGAADGVHEVDDLIEDDADDAMWYSCNDPANANELFYEEIDTRRWIVVAGVTFNECVGLRFQLDGIPNGARIERAVLTVWHLKDEYMDQQLVATPSVHAWNSVNVPPFSDTHDHQPEAHDPAGFVGGSVSWEIDTDVTTAMDVEGPDLAPLVQQLVDRSDWSANANIGFAIIDHDPALPYDVRIADHSTLHAGQPARLVVRYSDP